MKLEKTEVYRGKVVGLRELDNVVRQLVGLYGNRTVHFEEKKDELAIFVDNPVNTEEDENQPRPVLPHPEVVEDTAVRERKTATEVDTTKPKVVK